MRIIAVTLAAAGLLVAFALACMGCDGRGGSSFPSVSFVDSVANDMTPACDLLPACVPQLNDEGVLCGCVGLPCCFRSSGCGAQMNCVTPSCWGPGGICVPYDSPGLAGHFCADPDGKPGGVLCENGKECVRGVCVGCRP